MFVIKDVEKLKKNTHTHFISNKFFFSKIIFMNNVENVVQADMPQMTI